jgi:rubrerythrin
MGVRDVFSMLTNGEPTSTGTVHYECRRCGRNLTADDDRCPHCDGEVALYQLS